MPFSCSSVLAFALSALAVDGAPVSLFNGKDLQGWDFVATGKTDDRSNWDVEKGILVCRGHGGGWISTPNEYADFELVLDYRLSDGANSGVFVRAPRKGRISRVGIEIQIIDEHSPRYTDPKHSKYYKLKPYQRTGAVYGVQPPSKTVTKPAGKWNRMTIRAEGRHFAVRINGTTVVDCDLDDYPDKLAEHPGLKRTKGYLGLSSHNDRVEFRNVTIRRIGKP